MKPQRVLLFALFLLWLSPISCLAQNDPVQLQLVQLTSNATSAREAAFYALLLLGANQSSSNQYIAKTAIPNLFTQYPSDRDALTVALIQLLNRETSYAATLKDGDPDNSEGYGVYYSDVVASVSYLNDARVIPSLVPVIDTGTMVTDALAAYGPTALDSVLAVLYNPDEVRRDSAVFVMVQMLEPANLAKVSDAVSQGKIYAGLVLFLSRSMDSYMLGVARTALKQLKTPKLGDLNGDGLVDCSDLAIIKIAFSTKPGDPRFDIRADVNGDGLINVFDLAAEARRVSPQMSCE